MSRDSICFLIYSFYSTQFRNKMSHILERGIRKRKLKIILVLDLTFCFLEDFSVFSVSHPIFKPGFLVNGYKRHNPVRLVLKRS